MLVLLAAALSPAGCDTDGPAAPPGPEELTLGSALVTAALQGSLREAAVHLNNYGAEDEERTDSWHRSNDSFLRFGPSLGGAEVRFTIPESESKRGPFRFLYYVNDVNVQSDSITVGLAPDSLYWLLAVRLPFEEDGDEFKGHCLTDSFLSRGQGCLGSKDRIAPDVDMADAFVEVRLRPVVQDGGLGFEAVAAAFDGTLQAGGVCNIDVAGVGFDVCGALTGYEGEIRGALTSTVLDGFNRPDLQAQVAAGIRPILDAFGIGRVVYLRRAGDDLVVGHVPAS